MNNFRSQAGFLVLSFVLIGGCNFDPLRKSVTISSKPDSVLSADSVVSAEIVQKTALSTCQHCHSGVRQPDLSTPALVLANLSKIQSDIFSDTMPPASAGYNPVSDCYKDILKKWVELGTPETSDLKVSTLTACANGMTPPEQDLPLSQMPVDYQTLNSRILQPKCLSCHNPKGDDPDAADILLFPYSEMASRKNLLGTSSGQSKLVKLVTRDDENRMPPPDSKVQALTSEEVEFVKKWIDAGHPEKVN